jgi:hypothetical protein
MPLLLTLFLPSRLHVQILKENLIDISMREEQSLRRFQTISTDYFLLKLEDLFVLVLYYFLVFIEYIEDRADIILESLDIDPVLLAPDLHFDHFCHVQ